MLFSSVPGPLQSFEADLVFNDRVNLSWKKPCHPNGKPESYEITYYKTTSSIKSKVTVQPDKTSYVITDLDMLTEYMFEIRFKNDIDYGPSLSFIAQTKGPAGTLVLDFSNSVYMVDDIHKQVVKCGRN